MRASRIEGVIVTRTPICITDATEKVRFEDATMNVPRVKTMPIFLNNDLLRVKVIPGESIRGLLSHNLTARIADKLQALTADQLRALKAGQLKQKKDKKRKGKGKQVSAAPAPETEAAPENNIKMTPTLLQRLAAHPLYGNCGTTIGKASMEEGTLITHPAVPLTPDMSAWHPTVANTFASMSVPNLSPYLSPQANGGMLNMTDLQTVSRSRRSLMQAYNLCLVKDSELSGLIETIQDERKKNREKSAGGAADTMRRCWEVIPANLPFAHVLQYKPWSTHPVQTLNGLLLALQSWAQFPVVGGLTGIGYGQIQFYYDLVDTTGNRTPLFRPQTTSDIIQATPEGQEMIQAAEEWFDGLGEDELFPMLDQSHTDAEQDDVAA